MGIHAEALPRIVPRVPLDEIPGGGIAMNTIDAVRANELTKVDLELGEAEAMGFIDRDGRKVARNHDAREIISRLVSVPVSTPASMTTLHASSTVPQQSPNPIHASSHQQPSGDFSPQ